MIELTEEEMHALHRRVALIESELNKINKMLQRKTINQAIDKYKNKV